MSHIIRHAVALALLAAFCLVSGQASAWIETSIKSDDVTLELDSDGNAVVTHELLMKIRGGPLTELQLQGVDSDAEALPDASVAPARHGSRSRAIPLLPTIDGDVLRLAIDHPKGIRRGTFLFRFSYRTSLGGRGLIRPDGSEVEIRWVGPRFDDGIDSARVLFRVPSAQNPPHLFEGQEDPRGLGLIEEIDGVFLSNLRRGQTHDELEVIRPHVAKGEPVVWKIRADGKIFGMTAPVASPAPAPYERQTPPAERALAIGGVILLAVLYALLVGLKARAVSRASRLRGAEARPLVALPLAARAAFGGATLGAAAAVGVLTTQPTAAGALLALAMMLAAHRSPALRHSMRGPGEWVESAKLHRSPSVPGGVLDIGTLAGAAFLLGLLAVFGGGVYWLWRHSTYQALMLALGAASLLPIFCTGRRSELPPDPVEGALGFLNRVKKKLGKMPGVSVKLVARIASGQSAPDELRLVVTPTRPLSGMRAIELGFEYHQGAGGFVSLPCAIVRAVDGSDAYESLPRSVVWSRGRDADERVALIRPKLPSVGLSVALLKRLSLRLTNRSRPRQTASKVSNSAGSSSLTSNPSTVSSPAHAM